MNSQEDNSVEIDLVTMLKALWKRKLFIVLVAVVCAAVTCGYSVFLAEKEYESTSRIYVVSRQNEGNTAPTNSDLQAGAYLVKDYREIILSQNVLNETISKLSLTITPENLSKKIDVSVPVDTRILSITVKDPNPNEAARIANGLRKVAIDKIVEITQVPAVTTLDEAQVPDSPSSPQIRRNSTLGFILGGALMGVLFIIVELVDDRVKRPEDVDEVMGLPLLGVVPDMKKI